MPQWDISSFLDAVDEIRSQPTSSGAEAPFDHLTKILGLLHEPSRHPDIQSYVLFVRDPITDEMRLCRFQDVQHPEPLFAFVMDVDSEKAARELHKEIPSFPAKQYFANPRHAKIIAEKRLPSLSSDAIAQLVANEPLFGTFPERENVERCVRLEYPEPAETIGSTHPQVILFVNLRKSDSENIDSDLDTAIDNVFALIVESLKEIQESIDYEVPKVIKQFARILKPINTLAQLDLSSEDGAIGVAEVVERRSRAFNEILITLLESLGISQETALATVHLMDGSVERPTLHLVASTIDSERFRQDLDIFAGAGVASWVALHRKPLVIKDLSKSRFARIHDSHESFATASEVVVPMVVGQDLVGVLTIECDAPREFTPQDNLAILYAARQAAVAYRLCENLTDARVTAARNRQLLEIVHSATVQDQDPATLMNKLSGLVREYLAPDYAEIWPYEVENSSFVEPGSSYHEFAREIPIRQEGKGFTQLVRTTGTAIRIFDIGDAPSDFRCLFWNNCKGEWLDHSQLDCSPVGTVPESVNPVLCDSNPKIMSELGVPIELGNTCVGVLWLKYQSASLNNPSRKQMELVFRLAGLIALVLDGIQSARFRIATDAHQAITERIQHDYFPVGQQDELGGAEGYLLYKAAGARTGGDFCVGISNQVRKWGFLLGDMQGHGQEAALRMLPLITAARVFMGKSRSPRYAIEQLVRAAKDRLLGENPDWSICTAICFVYSERVDAVGGNQSRRQFLSATSAGHNGLRIVRQSGEQVNFPSDQSAGCPPLSPLLDEDTVAEETTEVFPGDLIIGFTDGIIEAANPNGDLYGVRRLGACASLNFERTPEQICLAIHQAAEEFAESELLDDATVLVIRILDT